MTDYKRACDEYNKCVWHTIWEFATTAHALITLIRYIILKLTQKICWIAFTHFDIRCLCTVHCFLNHITINNHDRLLLIGYWHYRKNSPINSNSVFQCSSTVINIQTESNEEQNLYNQSSIRLFCGLKLIIIIGWWMVNGIACVSDYMKNVRKNIFCRLWLCGKRFHGKMDQSIEIERLRFERFAYAFISLSIVQTIYGLSVAY